LSHEVTRVAALLVVKMLPSSQRFSIHFEARSPIRKEKSFFNPLHHFMYCVLYYHRWHE